VIKLRYSHPDVPRPYRIPFGKIGLWTAGILTTAWCALTTIAIIYPGIGTAHPDDSLPSGFEHQRLEYMLSQVIPLLVMILIGLLFYALGAPTRRQARADAASSEAVSSEAVPGGAPSSEAPSSEATSSEAPSSEAPSSETTSG
jgi:amino acid transporter